MPAVGWLEVKCHRCETKSSIPLDAIRRPRNTPIWKLEASLKMPILPQGQVRPAGSYDTETLEITPYVWVHPDEER
jgi:hypothetical protein